MGVVDDIVNGAKKTVEQVGNAVPNTISSVNNAVAGIPGMLQGTDPTAVLAAGNATLLPAIPLIGQYFAGQRGAEAAGKAAEAQLAQEQATRASARSAAAPSMQEMASLEQMIQMNSSEITRKQRLLDSADPALIEAGHQALGILQGADAKTLDPIRRQRAKDRAVLMDHLRSQLGPGAETSTAGIQALTMFDQATADQLTGAQNQTLSQLLGVAQNTSRGNDLTQNAALSGTASQVRGQINSRDVNAILGAPINNAGAPYVSDVMNAKNQAAMFSNLQNLMVQAGTTMAGMPSGGAPNVAPSAPQSPTANTGWSNGSSSYLGGNYNLPNYGG